MKAAKIVVVVLGAVIVALLAVLIFYPSPAHGPIAAPAGSQ